MMGVGLVLCDFANYYPFFECFFLCRNMSQIFLSIEFMQNFVFFKFMHAEHLFCTPLTAELWCGQRGNSFMKVAKSVILRRGV